MNLIEKKINGRTIYEGKIIKVELDEVELPDNRVSLREIVRHNGGASILLVEEGKVLLVKQFRYAYGKAIYEIPAGKLEKGEEPETAAKRELEEETGYSADLKLALTIYPTPGYTDEKIYVFFAENCVRKQQKLDDGEFLNYCFIKLDKVVEMIENGEINDGKTIAAVYKYLLNNK